MYSSDCYARHRWSLEIQVLLELQQLSNSMCNTINNIHWISHWASWDCKCVVDVTLGVTIELKDKDFGGVLKYYANNNVMLFQKSIWE